MIKLKQQFCSLIFISMLLIFFGGESVRAEGMDYSVKAIIPDNQIDKNETFFDLMVKPGDTQLLTLEITSTSSNVLNIQIDPHSATTNQNGELEFSVEPLTHDPTLIYPMSQLVSGSQLVSIEPKETKQVTFVLTIPAEPFLGKIVGGFTIYDQENNRDKSTPNNNDVQIRNIFSQVIGIQLQEKTDEIEPELRLKTVKANLFNYRTAVTANIQNTKPTFISQLNIKANIKKVGSDVSLYESEKTNMSMAPNSNFDFPIMLEDQEIIPGNYLLTLSAVSNKGSWDYTRKFEISNEEATDLNANAVELVNQPSPIKIGLLFILVLITLVVMSVMITLTFLKRSRAR